MSIEFAYETYYLILLHIISIFILIDVNLGIFRYERRSKERGTRLDEASWRTCRRGKGSFGRR